jgi:predicted deacylase
MAPPNETHPKIEITPPDISAYERGNTGIGYVTTFDSGRPGPHIMINALTHGNEICGAITIQFLMDNLLMKDGVRLHRGKLTLSFANVEAYFRFNSSSPFDSRYVDEDFNRLWSDAVLDGERSSQELERARQLRPLVGEADYLLDIHSMSQTAPPLMLGGLQGKSRDLAKAMGYPAYVVMDEGHKAGRRMRDYGGFDDPNSPKTALLVECGQHWARSTAEVARAAALHFLRQFDVLDADFITSHLPADPLPPQTIIEVTEAVTIAGRNFSFVEDYKGYEIIRKAGTVIGHNGKQEVKTPYDDCILIMPIETIRARPGQTAVRLGRTVG